MSIRSAILLILTSFWMSGFCQSGPEVGAWLGTAFYFGDLQTEFRLDDPGLAGGVNFRYLFNERLATKASLNYARIHASDANSTNSFERMRNLSFYSDIFDLTGQMEFNFLPYVHGSKDYFFTPYLFAGMSVFSYNPKTELNGTMYTLRDFGTEGQPIGEEYGRFSVALNYGIGVKWDINVDWSINIEAGARSAMTDYIDDVSTVYPDMRQLANVRGQTAVALSDRSIDGIGIPGRQRGNSKNNDMYILVGVSIMRYFGQLNCPKIVKDR